MSMDAEAIAEDIRRAARDPVSEATLRIRVEGILARYLATIGVTYSSVHERRTITTGSRTDALFGTVIIEYKRPGRLSTDAQWKEAAEQLQGYLVEEATRTGVSLERYAGLLIDGRSIGFVRRVGESWSVIGPEPVNGNNIQLALEYLRGLSRKPLDPERLHEDFGPQADVTRACIVAFWNALSQPASKPEMLYQEWRHLFGQVSGYKPEQLPEIAAIGREYAIDAGNDMPRLLFTIHTYFALIIKLLAAEILTLVRRGIDHSFVERVATLSSDEVRQSLAEMENGGVFRNLQIENLLEGDFFSWYLDQWNPQIAAAVHQVIMALQSYEPGTAILAPERVKDLLKRLYQHLVPATLRHDLGEFYTPDWLAGWVLDKVGFDGSPEKRLLDPSCGSGTFLILAINRVRAKAREQGKSGIENGELLQAITRNIVGFDLNPLAVVAARTNYILALGDLLEAQMGTITIPIYLSDSIFSPASQNTIAGVVWSYTIATQRGSIKVDLPVSLIEQDRLSPLLAEIEIVVQQSDADENECLERVVERIRLTPEEVESYGWYIKTLYREIKALELQNWNRIWARIIKNYYASASVGVFDIIAGNPPWLRWTRLPVSYRETIKDYCIAYGLFSQDSYVGGIETDISTILTYSAVEKWLKQDGVLGFLITQTVFKNISSEGFRKFQLPDGTALQVTEVHDMVALKPFENVANKTAALFLRKGKATVYPVPYVVWEKRRGARLRQDSTLEQVEELVQQHRWAAAPIYADGGPWLTAEPALLPTIQRMIGRSHFAAHKGITSDLNGLYWIEVLKRRADGLLHFRNLHAIGKHEVAAFEGVIEPDIVFPLARGRDARPFYIEDSHTYVIVPQNGMRGYAETTMRQRYRQALDYFRQYKAQLETRSSYKRYHTRKGTELGPYYSLWNVGTYTFALYKVAWREVQEPEQFCASYIGPKQDDFLGVVPVVPDHKLYFVPCETAEQAHYLCAFLNSLAVRAFIKGYTIDTQIATHITEYIGIPDFDATNPAHRKLSALSSVIAQERRAATAAERKSIEEIVENLLRS